MSTFPLKKAFHIQVKKWAESHHFVKVSERYVSQFHTGCPSFAEVVVHAIRHNTPLPDNLVILGWLTMSSPEQVASVDGLRSLAQQAFIDRHRSEVTSELANPPKGYPPYSEEAALAALHRLMPSHREEVVEHRGLAAADLEDLRSQVHDIQQRINKIIEGDI